MSLKDVLTQWLTHQIGVLLRRSRHRLAKIDDRLELLGGYLIAYLNLDRVIEIIRIADEPQAVLMEEFQLTDRQAEAILNMRLRSLRRLEEMEIRKERHDLVKEREGLVALIDSPARQRTRLKRDLAVLRERYGFETVLGARRTRIEEASATREIPLEARKTAPTKPTIYCVHACGSRTPQIRSGNSALPPTKNLMPSKKSAANPKACRSA